MFGRLPRFTSASEAYLLGEAHLEEAVGFVQDQRLQVLQTHRLGVAQVVDEPPLHGGASAVSARA